MVLNGHSRMVSPPAARPAPPPSRVVRACKPSVGQAVGSLDRLRSLLGAGVLAASLHLNCGPAVANNIQLADVADEQMLEGISMWTTVAP